MTEGHTVEIVTDGYFGAFPAEAYEKLYDHIEAADPYKIGEFVSTKTSDDRTVLIASLGGKISMSRSLGLRL